MYTMLCYNPRTSVAFVINDMAKLYTLNSRGLGEATEEQYSRALDVLKFTPCTAEFTSVADANTFLKEYSNQ